MTDAPRNTTAKLALMVAIISAGFTGVSLYFSWLQGPRIDVGVGQHVLVNSKPRIGVLCTIANTGSKHAIIDRGELKWEDFQPMPLTMISPKFEEWTFNDKGGRQRQSSTTFTLLSPIAIKGHDQATEILWFTTEAASSTAWQLSAGRHVLKLSLSSRSRQWSTTINIELSPEDVLNIEKSPYAEFPVKVLH